MGYSHTQKGPWYLLFLMMAAVLVTVAILTDGPRLQSITLGGVAGVFVVLSLSFRQMTVRDHGDELSIAYGPLPLFRKHIAYSEITQVEASHSSLIDGWGIHWIPKRGWTYNIWGFECVKLTLDNKFIRIGSDDVENLIRFLNRRI